MRPWRPEANDIDPPPLNLWPISMSYLCHNSVVQEVCDKRKEEPLVKYLGSLSYSFNGLEVGLW